ncbi:hypothetical protein V1520DRAFT_35995 [Lipomyces starkeyi]|uniref:Glycosyltransferase family 31 protein n=1 Tax=Lipomyces starkeyi NRRL Y-11557 TaxID=675824 RepID=A0A1E3PYE1_LIPST|nr:hypothetical protein LIPSTDRAFT_164299 [Lipomyces starkeyi NRRL Y-11557]
MRLVDRVCSPRKLAAILATISIVCFIGTLVHQRNVDIQNIRNSLPYVKYDKPVCESPQLAVQTFNSTYTHAHGIYANGYETSYVPGTEDVFLMIKTGATVLWQRFPIHIATTLPQLPHFAIYSDAPDMVAGIPIIDILAHTKRTTQESSQFATYRQQQALLAEHANIELTEAGITGGWQLDKYKNIPMVAHGYRTYPTAKWYIFMDADTYILWPNMMRWLSSINHEDLLYMGSVTYLGGKTPFVHGGSGVVMSGALVRKTFGEEPGLGNEYEEYSQVHCCGDHILSHAFRDRGTIPVLTGEGYPHVAWRFQGGYEGDLQAEPPISVRFKKENWCQEIVTFHHLTAHDIENLYDFERKYPRDQPILFKDVYHEFVMPYLRDDRRNGWDNLADIREYSNDREKDPKNPQVTAYNSYENCSNACQEWEECMQFRYRPGYCGLSNEIRLGRRHMDGDNSFSSFWQLDRIRQLRKSSGCDPIDAVQEEGAFFRKQAEA